MQHLCGPLRKALLYQTNIKLRKRLTWQKDVNRLELLSTTAA